jgi:hypothetical protein
VSTPQPPRRRRIAGEPRPGAPAPRTSPIKKVTGRRPSKPAAAPARRTTPPPPPTASSSAAERPPITSRLPRLDLSVFRRSGRLGALAALAVAALVFGAVFGIRGWNEWRGNDVGESHRAAASTAASASETIFTYRYDRLDEHLEDAQATMTPSFAEKFKTISPALNDLAPQRKIQVQASTRDAAPLECGNACVDDRARILVFIDQARLADDAKEPTVFGNRIEVEMVKRDGSWLVNDIRAL